MWSSSGGVTSVPPSSEQKNDDVGALEHAAVRRDEQRLVGALAPAARRRGEHVRRRRTAT